MVALVSRVLEDAGAVDDAKVLGVEEWKAVAEKVPGRSAKQCRERCVGTTHDLVGVCRPPFPPVRCGGQSARTCVRTVPTVAARPRAGAGLAPRTQC